MCPAARGAPAPGQRGAGATDDGGALLKRDSNGVQLSKEGKLGGSPGEEVDASDGAISVLKGGWCASKTPFANVRTDGCYALAGSVEYEMAQCEPSDSTAVCGEVMRALCEGPEGEPRWAADVRLGDSVRIVRKTAQAPQPLVSNGFI